MDYSTFKKKFDYVDTTDTRVTIRACDDTYFIIYTNNEEIGVSAGKQYPEAKIEKKELTELTFHY